MSIGVALNETFGDRPTVQQSSFIRVKTQFLCLYKQAMLQLYVNGHISDPGRWDDVEIARSMTDQGYSMVTSSGRRELSEALFLYHVFKEDYNEGIAEALNPDVEFYLDPKNWENYLSNYDKPTTPRMFYLAYRLRAILESLDRMYDALELTTKNKKTLPNRIFYSAGILKNKVKWALNEGSAILMAGYGSSIRYRSLGNGMSKATYSYFDEERPRLESEGRFVAGISVAQEAELLLFMLDGSLDFSGELSTRIYDWNRENLWTSSNTIEKSLENEIKRSSSGEHFAEEIRAQLKGIGDDERGLTLNSRGFYTVVEGETKALHMSGQYVFDSLTGDLLKSTAFLSGMNGELIEELTEEDAIEETGIDLQYPGSPVLVHSGEAFIPCQDVDFIGNSNYLHGGQSIFSRDVGSLSFGNMSPDDVIKGVDTSTVAGCIKSAYLQSENGYFGPVVGDEVLTASDYSNEIIKVAGEIH